MTAQPGAGLRRALILTAQIAIVAIAAGAGVGTLLSTDPLAGAVLGALASALITLTLCAFELALMPGPLGRGLRHAHQHRPVAQHLRDPAFVLPQRDDAAQLPAAPRTDRGRPAVVGHAGAAR